MKTEEQKQLERKELDIILKLNELTHKGKLRWLLSSGNLLSEHEEKYEATFLNQRFVFHRRAKSNVDTGLGHSMSYIDSLYIYGEHDEEPSLVITSIPALGDLYQTISVRSRQVALKKLEELAALLSRQGFD